MSTLFSDDRWILSLPGFKLLTPKPMDSRVHRVKNVIACSSKTLKKVSLRQLVLEVEVQAICSIPMALDDKEDSLVWHF